MGPSPRAPLEPMAPMSSLPHKIGKPPPEMNITGVMRVIMALSPHQYTRGVLTGHLDRLHATIA